MTSPPDVQNVPDIWTLLEDVVLDGGCGALKNGTVRRIILALTQRDRFVLVPLEPTPEIEHAWYNGPTSTHNRFREHWRNALAAALKPSEEPTQCIYCLQVGIDDDHRCVGVQSR